MTTNQRIESSREARLWATQVILPAMALMAVPEIRAGLANGYANAKAWVKSKLGK